MGIILVLHSSNYILLQGSYGFLKFWKVMKIDNAIFQDLESFGEKKLFENGYGQVLDFCLGKF